MPRGGSMVIFEPFCRMDTGNLLLGKLVSQRRKSRWTCGTNIYTQNQKGYKADNIDNILI